MKTKQKESQAANGLAALANALELSPQTILVALLVQALINEKTCKNLQNLS